MVFSKITEQILLKAGWSPNRAIDISIYEKVLNDEGYVLDNKKKEFLSKFGGLKVNHPHKELPKEFDFFELDPIKGVDGIYKETVDEYEKRVDEKLIVIGEACSEHMALLMSESGKIYGGYDDCLVLFGNDYKEAFETMCEGKDVVYIP